MKKVKSNDKRSHSQITGRTPEKTRKSTSFTQGDLSEDIEELLQRVTLKKPKRAFNYFIKEAMEKDKSLNTVAQATHSCSKKWAKLSSSEKGKYDEMAENDKKRYEQDLELVRKYILDKPIKEGATSYRLFLEDHVRKAIDNDADPKEAKKEASELWKNMSSEEKKEWNDKKKEHQNWYDELKKSRYLISPYLVFVTQTLEKAREKGEKSNFKEASEQWAKLKEAAKLKYASYAEEINENRKSQRDLYEIAFGVKPKRPAGAFRFFMMEAAKDGRFEGKNPIREGAKLWKKLSDEDKEKFQKMAHKAKLAYMIKKMEFQSQIKKGTSTRAASAFNLFMADQKGKELPKGTKFFEYVYKKWETLDATTKKRYQKKAEEEKEEFEKRKEELKSRVYDMPKRPANSLNLFIKQKLPELKKDNPKKETKELFKLSVDEWNSLSDKMKEKYEKQHEKEKEKYKSFVKDFETSGYYTPEKERASRKRKSQSMSRGNSESKGKRAKKSTKE